MRAALLLLALLPLGAARPTAAQLPGMELPSPEQMQQMMAVAKQAMNPVAAVLASREELALTAAQVGALEPIAARVSEAVERTVQAQQSGAQTRLVQAMSDPSVPIDEAGIRAEACEQATQQAQMMIETVRGRREMNAILTAEQRARVDEIQMRFASKVMQGMVEGITRH